MTSYLESLPRGVSSYPDYVTKATAFREFLSEVPHGRMGEMGDLPPQLMALLEHPPPVSSWLTEVHANALALALADRFFPSDDAFIARKLESNRRLLKGPLYRILFLFVSPTAMLQKVGVRWQMFHRGITLKVAALHDKAVKVRMDYPVNLVPELQARGYAMVLRAALEAAGGRDVTAKLASFGSTVALVEASWG